MNASHFSTIVRKCALIALILTAFAGPALGGQSVGSTDDMLSTVKRISMQNKYDSDALQKIEQDTVNHVDAVRQLNIMLDRGVDPQRVARELQSIDADVEILGQELKSVKQSISSSKSTLDKVESKAVKGQFSSALTDAIAKARQELAELEQHAAFNKRALFSLDADIDDLWARLKQRG